MCSSDLEKKGLNIAQIIHTPLFDKEIYEKALRKASGVFTKENHPEWGSISDVNDWLTKNRLRDQRTF